MPSLNLGITLDPVLQWATTVWNNIAIAVYLLVGMSVAFMIARGLLEIFGSKYRGDR